MPNPNGFNGNSESISMWKTVVRPVLGMIGRSKNAEPDVCDSTPLLISSCATPRSAAAGYAPPISGVCSDRDCATVDTKLSSNSVSSIHSTGARTARSRLTDTPLTAIPLVSNTASEAVVVSA